MVHQGIREEPSLIGRELDLLGGTIVCRSGRHSEFVSFVTLDQVGIPTLLFFCLSLETRDVVSQVVQFTDHGSMRDPLFWMFP